MLKTPILKTPMGQLYQMDCLQLLATLETESVDLAFADPPFNLGKQYSSKLEQQKIYGWSQFQERNHAYTYDCDNPVFNHPLSKINKPADTITHAMKM